MAKRLNVARLVADVGGPRAVARITGVARTAPYSWIRRNSIGSKRLGQIKAVRPELDLDYYFEETNDDEQPKAGCRA